MTLTEAREFANLRLQLALARAELRRLRARAKQATACGYNRALRRVARKPTHGALLEAWKQGKMEAKNPGTTKTKVRDK